jgi:hypothetical protein
LESIAIVSIECIVVVVVVVVIIIDKAVEHAAGFGLDRDAALALNLFEREDANNSMAATKAPPPPRASPRNRERWVHGPKPALKPKRN